MVVSWIGRRCSTVGLCDDEAKLLTRRGNDLVTTHETRFIESERVRKRSRRIGGEICRGCFDLAGDLHGVATSRGPVRRFNFAGKATILALILRAPRNGAPISSHAEIKWAMSSAVLYY